MSQDNSRPAATLKNMVLGGTLLIGEHVDRHFPVDALCFHRPLPSIEVSDLLQVSTQRSFLRLQPEFALALMVPTADSFAHRKASATVGGGDDSVTQCHFFTLSPSSTEGRRPGPVPHR